MPKNGSLSGFHRELIEIFQEIQELKQDIDLLKTCSERIELQVFNTFEGS